MLFTFDVDLIHTNNSIYINGPTQTGKTTEIITSLKNNDYDYHYIPIQQLKNEDEIENILKQQDILKFYKFYSCKKTRHIKEKMKMKVLVIDNIDHLQSQDKKILKIFTKFLKNKKFLQKYNYVRFIFIGINTTNKQVLELQALVPHIIYTNTDIDSNIDTLSQDDKNIEDTVQSLIYDDKEQFNDLYNLIYDDKTATIAFSYHENIIYNIGKNYKFYEKFLDNFCEGDYYYRITFQKQLWQFNDMTFYTKVFENYNLHKQLITNGEIKPANKKHNYIFTKIFTKYSNEYSNLNFIINICKRLNCSKEDLYAIFILESDIYAPLQELVNPVEKRRIIKLIS